MGRTGLCVAHASIPHGDLGGRPACTQCKPTLLEGAHTLSGPMGSIGLPHSAGQDGGRAG